jgi:hypothetical protein
MNALKEPDCINLAEGLALLERHLPAEQAKVRLREAFIRRALIQSEYPLFALPYDACDIDWMTGSVNIPRKKDRFCPTFRTADFNAYFFADRVASPSHPRQTAINADMCKALGAQALDEDILSGRAVQASQAGAGMSSPAPLKDSTAVETRSPPQPIEILTLKPTFVGMSLDLKELFRRAKAWWKRNK